MFSTRTSDEMVMPPGLNRQTERFSAPDDCEDSIKVGSET
jgi:hypothetical protein